MTDQQYHITEQEQMGDISLESIVELVSADSTNDVYEWGISQLRSQIGADMCKLAVATDGLLVPTVSTDRGETGRQHAIPIATTVPGSIFATGEPNTIADLENTRSGTLTAPETAPASSTYQELSHRSMVCAPVGNLGVLVGLAREPNAFDEADLEITADLGRVIAAAAERLGNDGAIGEKGATRMLEEIASMVSHDLRNKLNIMSGRLDLARETGEAEHFDACTEAVEGVESIADMVVTLARTGRPLDHIEEIELEETARRAFDPLNTPEAQLSIKASATILADKGCIAQLLENLFRNAIEHSNGPVSVEVGLLEDGFYIADDGPGIPDDLRDNVFELGFTTSDGNTGKGLAIVRRMADAHGWEIDLVESASSGTRAEIHGVVFG